MSADEIKATNQYPNWVADACSTPSSGPVSGTVGSGSEIPDDQLPGTGNKQKIWNYLISLGFTPVQTAGIYGNIGREGVFDPTNIEDPAGHTKDWNTFLGLTAQNQGYGLIGFTPGVSLAKSGTAGADWSGISGVNVNKDNFYYISTQLDVVYGYMKNSTDKYGKNMLQDYQNKATSPSQAATAFEDLVENAGVQADGVRDHIANTGMNKFGRGGASSGSLGGVSGATAQGTGGACCDTGSNAGPASGVITGDVQTLAQQVLQNKEITFDYGPSGKVAANFKRLANGDTAQTDTGRSVDVQPVLLVALLFLAQDHKVQVSSLTDGSSHVSSSDPHGMGDAMDLDYLDGTQLNNSGAVNKTVSGLEQVLPSGSHFGMGSPFSGTQTVNGKGFTAFHDNPHSVHFDVVGVDQNANDKAIADVGNIGGADITGAASATGGQCCATGEASFGTGTLPPSVPKPYNAIFTAAANKYGIAPALLAGIFYGGEHGNSWPDPPPPYGHGSPWASSSAGASGPFQFIPSTWAAYGVDGNGDGKKDIQDLTDGAFGAAKYLHASGARGSNESTFHNAIFAYNHAEWYVQNVLNAYHKFGGAASGSGSDGSTLTAASGSCSASSDAYQNPFRDVKKNGSLVALRIDEGVDYQGHGNVYALGDGVVSYVGAGPIFGGLGKAVVYKLSGGPAAGKSVYFSESCEPKVKVGDNVSSDTVICYMNGDNDPWTETGWAMGGNHEDYPCAWPQYTTAGNPDGSKMAYGVNFSQLLASLGAPAGNSTPGRVSVNPGTTVGSLTGACNDNKPASEWPTW